MDTDRVMDFAVENGERGAQVIQIENGRAVLAVTVCGVVAALGVGFASFAVYTAQQAAMEARILSQAVIEMRAELNHRKD